eukprot:Sspe_Gene.55683::Locus_30624_Transcript_1_1_Confidence_1.000_Length_1661::g.55683::m.55683/K02321/POLA2; DNA polymerase alpha subunit B
MASSKLSPGKPTLFRPMVEPSGKGLPTVTFAPHPEPTPDDLSKALPAEVCDIGTLHPTDVFRFIKDKPEKRSEVIQDRLEHHSTHIGVRDKAGLFTLPRTSALRDVSQNTQRYLVRVKDVREVASFMAEGYRGCGVFPVSIAKVQRCALFPGKIMGVEGTRLSDETPYIEASAIVDPVALPSHSFASSQASSDAKRRRVSDGADEKTGAPAKVMVVAGPFGTSAGQTLGMLHHIAKAAEQRNVALAIIIGPLVEEQTEFKGTSYAEDADNILVSFGDWVEDHASRRDPRTYPKFAFVPSVKDVFHDYVFPQPSYNFALGGETCEKGGIFHMLSNPGTITVNGVSLGVTSMDVLRHTKLAMLTKGPLPPPREGANRPPPALRQVVEQIVRSQCYYPLLPASQLAGSECPLDLGLYEHVVFRDHTPDILILPSLLPPFADDIPIDLTGEDRTVVVNPGLFRKGASPQSYPFVEISLAAADSPAVWRRVSVQWLQFDATLAANTGKPAAPSAP